MGSSVSNIAVQVPLSLCTDTLSWSGEWLSSFPVFFSFPFLYHSFLDAFSLISSFFSFFIFFLVFFTCFLSLLPLHSSFPPVWQSLILAWNWLPYIGSQTTALCQELITMKLQSKGSIFPGKCIQQFLFLACCMCLQYCSFCTGSSFRLQDQSTRGSVVHAEAPADTRLLGCFLFCDTA